MKFPESQAPTQKLNVLTQRIAPSHNTLSTNCESLVCSCQLPVVTHQWGMAFSGCRRSLPVEQRVDPTRRQIHPRAHSYLTPSHPAPSVSSPHSQRLPNVHGPKIRHSGQPIQRKVSETGPKGGATRCSVTPSIGWQMARAHWDWECWEMGMQPLNTRAHEWTLSARIFGPRHPRG